MSGLTPTIWTPTCGTSSPKQASERMRWGMSRRPSWSITSSSSLVAWRRSNGRPTEEVRSHHCSFTAFAFKGDSWCEMDSVIAGIQIRRCLERPVTCEFSELRAVVHLTEAQCMSLTLVFVTWNLPVYCHWCIYSGPQQKFRNHWPWKTAIGSPEYFFSLNTQIGAFARVKLKVYASSTFFTVE